MFGNFFKKAASFIILFFVSISSSHAFLIEPQNQTIDLSRGNSASISVKNNRSKDATLEFYIKKRIISEDGSETYENADEDFILFPPQALIKTKKRQNVRINWVGDLDPKESSSYHIFSEEVPVNLPDEEINGVRSIMKIGVSLHVTPKNAKSDLSISKVKNDDDGVLVTIVNNGNKFEYIDNTKITLSNEKQSRKYEDGELIEMAKRTLLLPNGNARTIKLLWPERKKGLKTTANIVIK